MFDFTKLKKLDPVLVILIAIFALFSNLNVFATTFFFGRSTSPIFISHITYWILGILLFVLIGTFNYKLLRNKVAAIVIFIVCVAMLLTVLIAGETILGAKRWINLGGFYLQPSEFAKLFLVIITANLCSQLSIRNRKLKILKVTPYLATILVIGILAGLTFLQNSLGNTVLILLIGLGVLFYAHPFSIRQILVIAVSLSAIIFAVILKSPELSINYAAAGTACALGLAFIGRVKKLSRLYNAAIVLVAFAVGTAAVPAAAYIYHNVIQDYQRSRIESFINPDQDEAGSWNKEQSVIACGAGQLTGKGFLQGTQSANGLLPFAYSDFAFCGFGEQFGFIGILILLLLYLVLFNRIVSLTNTVEDPFGRLLLFGTALIIGFNTLQHVGMNLGLLPITGVPLPLISAGGSAMLTVMASLGICSSILATVNKNKATVTKKYIYRKLSH